MNEASQYNEFEKFLSFQKTETFLNFIFCPHDTICLFTGNQWGKTTYGAVDKTLRVLGWHPIPKKNVLYFECPNKHQYVVNTNPYRPDLHLPKDNICPKCHEPITPHQRTNKIMRLCSETLPLSKSEKGEGEVEVKNTIYPTLKKWLPSFLIKKDITVRNTSLIVHDIYTGQVFGEGEHAFEYSNKDDIIFEFVSYSQTVQSQGGPQRIHVWYDEEPPSPFHEEQKPRLWKEDGDLLLTLTPANRISWTYDEFFEKAQIYYRTPFIVKRMEKLGIKNVKVIEKTDSPLSIAVFQASTYDNPTISKEVIDKNVAEYAGDDDVLDVRIYGFFRQTSSQIFKHWTPNVHGIDPNKWFPNGEMFADKSWIKARIIDYHTSNPWAVIFVALSPDDEAFVWWEDKPSPEKLVTLEIANTIGYKSGDHIFMLNLIDPLAKEKQPSTGRSVVDDLNDIFAQMRKEGICTGGYWEAYDTKSTRGRDEINKRLKNSLRVGRPFNNKVIEDERTISLPTLWVFNNCWETMRSLHKWKKEEHLITKNAHTKEMKETPCQKWSHFCTALEAVFKDNRFRVSNVHPVQGNLIKRFQGGRK
jgi:phage terminase large subunit-like protein